MSRLLYKSLDYELGENKLPRLLEQGWAVRQEDRLHHEKHLGQALQVGMGLGQVDEDVLRRCVRLLAE